jgi:hypothetical protein
VTTVEKVLERLMCDPIYRAEYLADPDKCLSEAGLTLDLREQIKALDLDCLRAGTHEGQRRAPSLNQDECRGGSGIRFL